MSLQGQQSPPPLCVIERLLLAQCIHEFGAGNWTTITKTLNEHPMLHTRTVEFFTEEICVAVYRQMMTELGFNVDQPFGPVKNPKAHPHAQLAWACYVKRIEELKNLIKAEEERFRTCVTQLDEIAAGKLDNELKQRYREETDGADSGVSKRLGPILPGGSPTTPPQVPSTSTTAAPRRSAEVHAGSRTSVPTNNLSSGPRKGRSAASVRVKQGQESTFEYFGAKRGKGTRKEKQKQRSEGDDGDSDPSAGPSSKRSLSSSKERTHESTPSRHATLSPPEALEEKTVSQSKNKYAAEAEKPPSSSATRRSTRGRGSIASTEEPEPATPAEENKSKPKSRSAEKPRFSESGEPIVINIEDDEATGDGDGAVGTDRGDIEEIDASEGSNAKKGKKKGLVKKPDSSKRKRKGEDDSVSSTPWLNKRHKMDEDKQSAGDATSLPTTPMAQTAGLSESELLAIMTKGHDRQAIRRSQKSLTPIIAQISQTPSAAIFRDPVREAEAPGYSSVIKRPMDLKTIGKRIRDGLVTNSDELRRDLLLMAANACCYNKSDTTFFRDALATANEVERLIDTNFPSER